MKKLLGVFLFSLSCLSHSAHAVVPIVFHEKYDISFFGIQKLHPFDTQKYGKIARHISKTCNIRLDEFQKPTTKVSDEELLLVHTSYYLETLKSSSTIAQIAELPLLSYVPNFLLQHKLLNPIRFAVAGTVLAAQLALEHGWAINLSGGYHHAKITWAEGFCFFADIPLAIKKLRETKPNLKVLIVDLDAHQGNGLESIVQYETLKNNNKQTFIFDMFCRDNYPRDYSLYEAIDFKYPLKDYINDEEYLEILTTELPKALAAVNPDLIIYNAGSDIFEKDPLGKMSVTKNGILRRDAFVFTQALGAKTPILMVLSGGYSRESADIVGTSIENIIKTFKLVDIGTQAHQ